MSFEDEMEKYATLKIEQIIKNVLDANGYDDPNLTSDTMASYILWELKDQGILTDFDE